MDDKFSLYEILGGREIKLIYELFDVWKIEKQNVESKDDLIDVFIRESRKKERLEYILKKLTLPQYVLVLLTGVMDGRVKISLLSKYGLRESILHSFEFVNPNLDDIALAFVDRMNGEYFIPKELVEGISDIIKNLGEINIFAEENIEPAEKYNFMEDLLKFLCFVDANDVKIKTEGEIYKKELEKIIALFDYPNNMGNGRIKNLLILDYVKHLRRYAETAGLISKTHSETHSDKDYFMTATDNVIPFLKKDISERYDILIQGMSAYTRKILSCIKRYTATQNTKNLWISNKSFFEKVRMEDIQNFKKEWVNKSHLSLFELSYDILAQEKVIDLLANYGLIELSADYNNVSGRVVKYFRLRSINKEQTEDDKFFIVHPNFEITAFPYTPQHILFMLNRIAEIVKFDVAFTYRLTKSSILRALNKGMDKDEIISFIKNHGRNEIPNNVEHSLNDWFSGRKFVSLCRATFLETEKNLLAPVLEHIPEAKKINENFAIINEENRIIALELIKAYKRMYLKVEDAVLFHEIVSKIKMYKYKIVEPDIIIIENEDVNKAINLLKKDGIIVK